MVSGKMTNEKGVGPAASLGQGPASPNRGGNESSTGAEETKEEACDMKNRIANGRGGRPANEAAAETANRYKIDGPLSK